MYPKRPSKLAITYQRDTACARQVRIPTRKPLNLPRQNAMPDAHPIWSDPVNHCRSVGLFLSLFVSFFEDRASSSRGRIERRLIRLIFAGRNRIIMIRRELPRSKDPPAEPEALRLLAPQRGLIATGEKQKQKQLQRHETRWTMSFDKTKATAGGILPEFSKFDCLPGRAGGSPDWTRVASPAEPVA